MVWKQWEDHVQQSAGCIKTLPQRRYCATMPCQATHSNIRVYYERLEFTYYVKSLMHPHSNGACTRRIGRLKSESRKGAKSEVTRKAGSRHIDIS